VKLLSREDRSGIDEIRAEHRQDVAEGRGQALRIVLDGRNVREERRGMSLCSPVKQFRSKFDPNQNGDLDV